MHSDRSPTSLFVSTFTAMATSVIVSICSAAGVTRLEESVKKIKDVFQAVEESCSRFDGLSDLSRLNQTPEIWHNPSAPCFYAIREAYSAYQATRGLFDPRILSDLIALGYKESWTKGIPDPRCDPPLADRVPLEEWKPEFTENNGVRPGGRPIDLGGIGKGLALKWSAKAISASTSNFLIEAGGDCVCSGAGPEGTGWDVGVQNPHQPEGDPVMVLRLSNHAVCTSSIAVRSWWQNGALRHHLIDPATGKPGGPGLAAVTVVSSDPARAEVWSKALFILGETKLTEFSESEGIAAAWITDRGQVVSNSFMDEYVTWKSLVQ